MKKKINKMCRYLAITMGVLIAFIAISLALIFFKPWRYITQPQEKHFNAELRKNVRDGKEKIPLRDLTDFSWDSTCVYQGGEIPDYPDAQGENIIEGVKVLNPIPDLDEDMWGILFKDSKQKTGYLLEITAYTFSRERVREYQCRDGDAYFLVFNESEISNGKTKIYKRLFITY